MQYSSALFVVFVVFVVLRYEKNKSEWGTMPPPGFDTQGVLPVLSFKPPTSRTPRTKPMDIGEIAFVVRQETSKLRTWSMRQLGNLDIKVSVRVFCLTNVSLRLLHLLRNGPLGHFRVKPFLWPMALLKELPQFR